MHKNIKKIYLKIEEQEKLGHTNESQLRPFFHTLLESFLPNSYVLSFENRYISGDIPNTLAIYDEMR